MADKPSEVLVEGWLAILKISLLVELDVLIYLKRHSTSLVSAGQISHLLGYGKGDVGKALDSLGNSGLLQRSRSSQGVRLYRFEVPAEPDTKQIVQELLKLCENRSGRLIVSRIFSGRPRTPACDGLHLA